MARRSKKGGKTEEEEQQQAWRLYLPQLKLARAGRGRRRSSPDYAHAAVDAAPLPRDPSQIGGDWTDRSIPAPPSWTFKLELSNKPEAQVSVGGGPVRSLASYAADVVARNLDAFDPSLWTDGECGMSVEAARHVVRALQDGDGEPLEPGNWVAFVGGYGASVLSSPSVAGDDLDPDPQSATAPLPPAAHAQLLHIPFKEFLFTLQSSPPTSPLLQLNDLAHFRPPPGPSSTLSLSSSPLSPPLSPPGHVLSVLDLSNTAFSDADCKAIKHLTFLTALSTDRSSLTDAGVRFLTSALYVGPVSTASAAGPEKKGLYNLRAWSLVSCSGVTDRAAMSLRAWASLCYIDIRRTSATPSAFLQILNRPAESASSITSPSSQQHGASRFALASPPEAKSTLLETLLAAPERFPFFPLSSAAATCTISTRIVPHRRPSTQRASAAHAGETAGPRAEDDVERPRGLVPTPLGGAAATKRDDVVLLRRSPSTRPIAAPTAEPKRKTNGDAEVAQVKRRKSAGAGESTTASTSSGSAGLWGAILGHAPSAPSSSPASSSSGLTPSRRPPLLGSAAPGRTTLSQSQSTSLPTAAARRASSQLPLPPSISSRPFQPPPTSPSSSAPVHRGAAALPSAAAFGARPRPPQPSAARDMESKGGFATARPSGREAKIGDGGRAFKGVGSIFRGAKWS